MRVRFQISDFNEFRVQSSEFRVQVAGVEGIDCRLESGLAWSLTSAASTLRAESRELKAEVTVL
jgi:hypothetical protein